MRDAVLRCDVFVSRTTGAVRCGSECVRAVCVRETARFIGGVAFERDLREPERVMLKYHMPHVDAHASACGGGVVWLFGSRRDTWADLAPDMYTTHDTHTSRHTCRDCADMSLYSHVFTRSFLFTVRCSLWRVSVFGRRVSLLGPQSHMHTHAQRRVEGAAGAGLRGVVCRGRVCGVN